MTTLHRTLITVRKENFHSVIKYCFLTACILDLILKCWGESVCWSDFFRAKSVLKPKGWSSRCSTLNGFHTVVCKIRALLTSHEWDICYSVTDCLHPSYRNSSVYPEWSVFPKNTAQWHWSPIQLYEHLISCVLCNWSKVNLWLVLSLIVL